MGVLDPMDKIPRGMVPMEFYTYTIEMHNNYGDLISSQVTLVVLLGNQLHNNYYLFWTCPLCLCTGQEGQYIDTDK